MSNVSQKLAKKSGSSSGVKQIRLKLVTIDIWSAARLSFLLSLALGIAGIIGTFLLWQIVDKLGLFNSLNSVLATVAGSDTGNAPQATQIFGLGRVMGFSMMMSIVNVVLGTVLGALVATLYNLSVRISGGLLIGFTNVK